MKNTVGTLVVLYLLIGFAIVGTQRYTGTLCDPPRMVPAVTANYPPGVPGALQWPISFYENVLQNDVPLMEYFSPTRCVEKP